MRPSANILLFTTMILSSFAVVLRKTIVGKMDPPQFEIIAGAAHFFYSVVAFRMLNARINDVTAVTGWLIFLQTFLSAVAVFTFTYGIRSSSNLGAASALVSASPALTMLLSVVFLGERPDLRTIAGVMLTILGTALVATR